MNPTLSHQKEAHDMPLLDTHMDDSVFTAHESEVRSYCRNWPAVFTTAKGSYITDQDGREYLDFFAVLGP